MGARLPEWGLTLAAIQIGKALDGDRIQAVRSAMSILLVVFWLFTAGSHVRAVWPGEILYPDMDMDKDVDV